MDKLMKKKRWQLKMKLSSAGSDTTKVSLMYPNEKKQMMVVFDEEKRMIGVLIPDDLYRYAIEVDENSNTAIFSTPNLKRILLPKENYFNSLGNSND